MKRFLPIDPHQNTLFKHAFVNNSRVRSHYLMMKLNTCAPLMPPHSNQRQQHCTFTSSSSLLQSSFASIHQHYHSSSTNRPQQQQTTPSTTTNHTHLLNQPSSSSLSQSTIQQIRSYSTSLTHDNSNNSNHTFATTTTAAATTLIQQQQQQQQQEKDADQQQQEGEKQLYMTDACSKRIHYLNEINGNLNRRLRVSVQYGGCSGYKVDFAFDDSEMDPLDDVLFEHYGSTIVVDVESLKYVKGSTVDYVETLGSSKFQMQSNPNADSKCSCGSSFNIII